MKVLYFAWLRARLGTSAEDVPLTPEIRTIGDLVSSLRERGGGYGKAFANPAVLKAAVNHEYVPMEYLLRDSDEVALFPPVTGG